MDIEDWFLTGTERGNPACRLPAWCTGNAVTPLVDGATYFARLVKEVRALRAGDQLFFSDWRGDADERLTPDGPTLAELSATPPAAGWSSRG